MTMSIITQLIAALGGRPRPSSHELDLCLRLVLSWIEREFKGKSVGAETLKELDPNSELKKLAVNNHPVALKIVERFEPQADEVIVGLVLSLSEDNDRFTVSERLAAMPANVVFDAIISAQNERAAFLIGAYINRWVREGRWKMLSGARLVTQLGECWEKAPGDARDRRLIWLLKLADAVHPVVDSTSRRGIAKQVVHRASSGREAKDVRAAMQKVLTAYASEGDES